MHEARHPAPLKETLGKWPSGQSAGSTRGQRPCCRASTNGLQRLHGLRVKWLDVHAPKRRDVPTGTQRLRKVLGQNAYVGPFEHSVSSSMCVGPKSEQRQFEELDVACLALDLHTRASEFVERLAVPFQGGIHRRNLCLPA